MQNNLIETRPIFATLTEQPSSSYPPIVKAPRFWQLLQWTFRPLEFLDNCAQHYGDCFITRIGKAESVFFSQPEAIAHIFSNPELFDSGRAQQALKYSLGQSSVLTLDGEQHRQRRQLLMPPFHGERMRNYGDVICQITEQVTHQWQPRDVVTLLPFMNEITLEVILKVVFGLSEGERYQQLKDNIAQFLKIGADPFSYMLTFFPGIMQDRGPWKPLTLFLKRRQQVDELLYAEIRERRARFDPNRTDILTLLISAKDEAGDSLTDQELRDELMTMLLAGHDSSAATLSWTLYMLHASPTAKNKLLNELASVDDPTAITRLPYLNAVCSEALRLRSAGPTVAVRVTNQPVKITGYELPANTVILPCQYLTHHREDIYPNPRQFQPERFLERQYSPYEYYPFGGNNRRCIGAAFAGFEMKLVLATILKRYLLELAEKPPISAVRRGVNISPKGGVRMRVLQRL
ncbi:cytochrome P450 [Leptolyngbya sp. NK1-12]|uniref:Cytochrome P450 n=1 Tax=Leptolyngbya sp. NK1-12 TaxID=2547451 RepID=A0AA96WBW4_9CYAN|nr:cytochrome P450 [Leptolyngbya sp. NK1-12]WNZ21695.1 cytochrome P450 [Leptolyngbya sp. NK1-12]